MQDMLSYPGFLIKERLDDIAIKGSYVEILDQSYLIPDLDTLKAIVKTMPIRLQKYTKETHDCDDFAREFWALATKMFPGVSIGYGHFVTPAGKHAANIAFYHFDGMLRFTHIEPQSGKITEFSDWKAYMMII